MLLSGATRGDGRDIAVSAKIDHAWRVAQRHQQAGRIRQAETFCHQVLSQTPNHAGALHLLGVIALQQGDAGRGIGLIETAIRNDAGDPRFHSDLGMAYAALGDAERALACYRRAVAAGPDYVQGWLNLGGALTHRNALQEAADCYRRAAALQPELAMTHYNLGCVLFLAGHTDEASAGLERALALTPDYVEAMLNLGLVRTRQRRYDEAVGLYRRILALRPDFARAHINLGGVLVTMGRYDEAAASSRRALELQPDSALAHYNLALAHQHAGRQDDAEDCSRRALALRPDYVDASIVLGQSLYRQGRIDEAIVCLKEALALRPQSAIGHSALIFALLNTVIGPQEVQAHYRGYARAVEQMPRRPSPHHDNGRDPQRRLRIGYVSPDLREHSVAHFFEPVIAHHDHAGFEIHCYYNHSKIDATGERLRAAADHWTPCIGMTDEELAARIRADGIDILVDLAGHTSGGALTMFALKPAPVQASWLGYPATTGLDAMDYRLCSADTDPPGEERWHSERLYRLPRSLWCYRPRAGLRPAAERAPLLARGGEVHFGSMNNLAKVSPQTIETWARILLRVPGSRLVMTGVPEGRARRVLGERFAAHGVGMERLLLNGRLSDEAYGDLLDTIDIALDPFPYNGTTTTCETLWRGVPLVSLVGERSVSRSGYALLRQLELEWLAAADREEYVELAATLAGDAERLTRLRGELRERFAHSSLRDEAGFTLELEQAYRDMWRDWCEREERS
jgi:predicted O-linked N-acetylglucosamine transferase (SPINDLY family)